MTTLIPLCFTCKHFHDTGDFTRDALPDGVPDAIKWDEHDHREAYPGDHGIRFERRVSMESASSAT